MTAPQTDYYRWQAPSGGPAIKLRHSVMDKIHSEVMEGFMAVPKRGAEVGGVLLGGIEDESREVIVDDFEPVPCEHRFGPSWHLSPADTQNLEETLEWFRSGAPGNLSVVGFYRSHTRYGFFLGEQDDKLLSKYFADESSAILLIKPLRVQNSVADFFFWENGRPAEAATPVRFPFGLPAIQGSTGEAPEKPEEVPVEEVAVVVPPPAFQVAAKSRVPNWVWLALTIAMVVAGGILGYESLGRSPTASARVVPAPTPQASPLPAETASPMVSPAPPAPSDQHARSRLDTAPPQKPDDASIRIFLARWVNALKRGDADAYVSCYATELSVYFTKANVTRPEVHRSVEKMLKKYGRLDVYRISDIRIEANGPNRAYAVFRKHWQTSGRRKFAGEERERLGLVNSGGRWQIASEEELNLYWIHKGK